MSFFWRWRKPYNDIFFISFVYIPIWWCRLFSWESTIKINNLEITDLHMLTYASLRTQENNFGSKYVKIFQDYFANVRPQESHVHWGGSSLEHICTSNPRQRMSHDVWGGMGLYMTLEDWEPGFKSLEMDIHWSLCWICVAWTSGTNSKNVSMRTQIAKHTFFLLKIHLSLQKGTNRYDHFHKHWNSDLKRPRRKCQK